MTLLQFDAIIISCQDSSVVGASVAITFRMVIAEKDDWLYSKPCAGSAYSLYFLSSFFFFFNPNVFIKDMYLPWKYIMLIKKKSLVSQFHCRFPSTYDAVMSG